MEDKVYALSDDFSLFKGDFKEKKFQLFNISSGTIYKLNEVAYDMLSLFDGKKNLKMVANELKKMYNIRDERLKNDLYGMVKKWLGEKILIEKE